VEERYDSLPRSCFAYQLTKSVDPGFPRIVYGHVVGRSIFIPIFIPNSKHDILASVFRHRILKADDRYDWVGDKYDWAAQDQIGG
jgi:hypothetical protein